MTPTRESASTRTLTVLVDRLAVEDGQIEPPAVGAVTSFPLLFVETSAGQPDSMTVRATLEPDGRAPTQQETSWWWHGLLRGDGWTATWHGPRPRTGRVEVTGQFWGVIGIDASGSVRGRVTTVDVAIEYWNQVDTRERWASIPNRRDYRSVQRSPRFFSDQRHDDAPPSPARAEIGVLITLDLDDVPELPLRRDFVAGSVSAVQTRIWVVDRALPVVVCIDENATPTMHLLPAPVTYGRRVWATPTGCWVSSSDGTFRVDVDAWIGRRVSDIGTIACAVNGEWLLACTATGPWQIHTPQSDALPVEPPDGTPVNAVADADCIVVLLEVRNAGRRRLRLIRVDPTGVCTAGPVLDTPHRSIGLTQLLGNPLTLAHQDGFSSVTTDLDIGITRSAPRSFFDAGTVGEYMWIIGHPPTRCDRTWWPLEGPVEYDLSRGKFWLVTILDRLRLQPVHVAPVLSSGPSVTVDASGTIWLASAGELVRISDMGGSMQWPETVDVVVPEP